MLCDTMIHKYYNGNWEVRTYRNGSDRYYAVAQNYPVSISTTDYPFLITAENDINQTIALYELDRNR